jgi:VanZ family protein
MVGSILPEMAPPETYNLDKGVHLGAYGVLALVLACLRGVGPIGAVLLATGLSGLAELTQLGSPWRHASLGDFLANALGAVLGVLVHRVLTRRFPALFRPSPPPGDAP